ncbi:MAG TPA: aquaporin, partial [Kamptonema sp.]|nr:aquaporin [Kamptonema sp.]
MLPIKRYVAEFMGTFWLVFGGCGSAVLAAVFTADAAKIAPNVVFPVGVGLVGVSMAFGLTVLTMAFAIGHISGCHLNPAVSFGLFFGKRFSASELLPYIIAQVAGAILAGFVLYLIASGKPGFEIGGFAANGYGENSPGKYGLVAAFLAEFVLTFMFLIIILG